MHSIFAGKMDLNAEIKKAEIVSLFSVQSKSLLIGLKKQSV